MRTCGWGSQVEKGAGGRLPTSADRAADHPGRGGLWGSGTFLRAGTPGRSLRTTPLARARCATFGRREGGARRLRRAPVRPVCAVCVCVCLRRAGSSLFTGESHPETQALFLSGLSQVEESIKPPDPGKGRQNGARSADSRRRVDSAADGRRGPAMPALWLSGCLCLALLLPAARATSRREGESASPSPGGPCSPGRVTGLALQTLMAERTSEDSLCVPELLGSSFLLPHLGLLARSGLT